MLVKKMQACEDQDFAYPSPPRIPCAVERTLKSSYFSQSCKSVDDYDYHTLFNMSHIPESYVRSQVLP